MATVVAFHAHPDDEVLVTGGTLALLAAAGHRVVIVTATTGWMGAPDEPGADVRLAELRASAAVLGAARVETLGYADSGHGPLLYDDPPGRTRFARADPAQAAGALADLLRDERAELLLSYDAAGHYGHRDHVQVHHVGTLAAEQARVRVLEATVPRELVARLARPLTASRLLLRHDPAQLATLFTPAAAITHRVNVRPVMRQKQAALAAHRSQFGGGGRSARLKRLMVTLPPPVAGLAFGYEWYAEPGARPQSGRRCGDVLTPVR